MSIRIEVPQLPPAESSPNARKFWAEKYKAGKDYHRDVFYCCVDARNRGFMRGLSFPFIKAKLTLTFVFADSRTRDADNLQARFKPGQDAIVDAGLVIDDDSKHLRVEPPIILVDRERAPLTVIELSEGW